MLLNLFLFLILPILFRAQVYQQTTHIIGGKKVNSDPVFGNNEEFSIESSIGGLQKSLSFLLSNHEILLFFGTGIPSEISADSNIIQSRSVVYDTVGVYYDTIWKYSTSQNQWKLLNGREETNQVYDSAQGYIGARSNVKGWMNEENGHTIISLFGGSGYIKENQQGQDPTTFIEYELKCMNEFWKYNVTSNKFLLDFEHNFLKSNRVFRTYENEETTVFSNDILPFPGGRNSHEIVKLNENSILLVGGEGFLHKDMYSGDFDSAVSFVLGDWWVYTIDKLTWECGNKIDTLYSQHQMVYGETNVYHSSNLLGSVKSHSGCLINEEEVLIFGGERPLNTYISYYSNMIHKYNISSNMWKYVSGNNSIYVTTSNYGRQFEENNFPLPRSGQKLFKIKDNELLLFGGKRGSNDLGNTYYHNDEWRYNTENGFWKFSGLESTKYTNRYIFKDEEGDFFGAMESYVGEYIPETDELYIIGGFGYDYFEVGCLNDVWRVYLGFECFSMEANDPSVCSGKGICQDFDVCQCNEGYFGDNCEISKCSGTFSNETNVCSNNGKCVDSKCQCYDSNSYVDQEDCSIDSNLKAIYDYYWIFIVVPVVALILLAIFVVVIIFFIILITKLKTDLKRFNEIEDIELVLEEQKISKDSSIAHFNINKSLFEIDVKDIKVLKKIGQGGGSAVVYSAMWNKQKVAYKCFMVNEFLEEEKFKEFEKEVEILASVSFPYILSFYGATMNSKRLGFVMEFAEHGDLEHFLKTNKGRKYPLNEKLRMLYEISSAMLYLHNNKIIHRDLKLQNVLVTEKEETKLMDFGLSKVVEDEKTRTKKVGTSYFIAPEVVSGHYGKPCDVYSFAMVMFIVLSGNFLPFGDFTNTGAITTKILNNPSFRPDMKILEKLSIPKKIRELIRKNWEYDPKKRMGFSEISEILENFKDDSNVVSSENRIKRIEELEKENEELKLKLEEANKKIQSMIVK